MYLCVAAVIGASSLIVAPAAFAGAADWLGVASSPGGVADADLKAAREDYAVNCATCHGRNGDGKGELSDSLSVPPRDHTDAKYMGARTDEQLFKAIRDGGAAVGKAEDMPPHSAVMNDAAIRRMVKYLRRLCDCGK
ncbi:MAG: cytochrome c [Nitrospinae bacterium]|nr:cytochrome c [Nitrospinota bacterium]